MHIQSYTVNMSDCFLADKEAVRDGHHSPESSDQLKNTGDNSCTSSS
jgi:hypothetical protein